MTSSSPTSLNRCALLLLAGLLFLTACGGNSTAPDAVAMDAPSPLSKNPAPVTQPVSPPPSSSPQSTGDYPGVPRDSYNALIGSWDIVSARCGGSSCTAGGRIQLYGDGNGLLDFQVRDSKGVSEQRREFTWDNDEQALYVNIDETEYTWPLIETGPDRNVVKVRLADRFEVQMEWKRHGG